MTWNKSKLQSLALNVKESIDEFIEQLNNADVGSLSDLEDLDSDSINNAASELDDYNTNYFNETSEAFEGEKESAEGEQEVADEDELKTDEDEEE